MLTDVQIQEELEKIKLRNWRVEAEKAWENSWQRKASVASTTYLVVLIVMFILNFENIFVNALIPTCWYLLSTLWINPLKKNTFKNI